MSSFSFDYSPYNIHPAVATPLFILFYWAWLRASTSGDGRVRVLAAPVAALFISSKAFACFAMCQLEYLWHHSLCPWYMAAELFPLGAYAAPLPGLAAAVASGVWPDAAMAFLDILSWAAGPLRALFYIVVVNVVFFAYCYRVLAASWRMSLAILRGLLSLVMMPIFWLKGALGYKGASPSPTAAGSRLRSVWSWIKSRFRR